MGDPGAGTACVFAPSPLLTVTIEAQPEETDIHFHPGGQGYWIARMIAALGVEVALCTSFGGEAGQVIRGLVDDDGITLRATETTGHNGSYVHDRRSGERVALFRSSFQLDGIERDFPDVLLERLLAG